MDIFDRSRFGAYVSNFRNYGHWATAYSNRSQRTFVYWLREHGVPMNQALLSRIEGGNYLPDVEIFRAMCYYCSLDERRFWQ